MVTQILVPLDGSPMAEQALSCAVMLSQGLPAELVLFRAVSIPPDVQQLLDTADLQARCLTEQAEVAADDYLAGKAHSLREAGLSVRHVVQSGSAAETIVDYAGGMDIHLVVMATHGYTGVERWTHGSVAERVLQAASVPVLLVRAQEQDSSDISPPMLCRRILVPLDGSNLAEQILPAVTPIALALRSRVILFQVSIVYTTGSLIGEWHVPLAGVYETADQNAHAYLGRMANRLKEQGVETSTATEIGAVSESIIGYAKANRIDLIAMCTHGRTGLARWALGSVADRVLRAAGLPILLVRAS